ncbi:hypothetical protein [Nocardia brasiliensis]|uniref:hypothetical protein n=1 Tax=Nocardia brasiliensis TaxID=37326 RepID=UPI0024551D1D|nr:hypothetical protein [Nocardia brasiliensis]
MRNREQRRAAQRQRRRQGNPLGSPRPLEVDRVFPATENYEISRRYIAESFSTLHVLLGLIESLLKAAETPDPAQWFPNNITAHAALVRSYQGLQAAANLCALGFYVESYSTLRGVYEAAGLARALAHKTDVAERWVRAGDWVKDKFSRDFVREINPDFADEDTPLPHWEMYQRLSKFAHPMAKSTLRFNFDRDGKYSPHLYPEVDEEEFREVAVMITLVAIFVAYALRNAAADFEAIPGWWHEQLAAVTREFTGEPMGHLNQDWAEHQTRFEALQAAIRPDAELRDTLRADPNSLQNLRSRTVQSREGSSATDGIND